MLGRQSTDTYKSSQRVTYFMSLAGPKIVLAVKNRMGLTREG